MNRLVKIVLLFSMSLILSACIFDDEEEKWDADKVCPETGTNAYGMPNRGTFTDERDGQVYKTIQIGEQIWMAQNLNYAYTGVKFRAKGNTSDSTSWCYENKVSNCDKYGRLYTWSAVMDSAAQFIENARTTCGYSNLTEGTLGSRCNPNSPHRGICPEGWHVPTEQEFSTLHTYIGGSNTGGLLLKSTSGWYFKTATEVALPKDSPWMPNSFASGKRSRQSRISRLRSWRSRIV